jgi:methionyl-tRNA formyltransferase
MFHPQSRTLTRPLNVLLFAFGHAGVAAIRSLRNAGHHVSGCFTHRTTQHWLPSVEEECLRLAIPCSTDPTAGQISPGLADRPDVVLSVFYRRQIQMPFLGLGTIGAFNVATSQLPRYRGHFPFRWAILNDESAWGVTVHQMTPAYCDGAVLHRRPVALNPTENAYDLYLRLSEAASTAAVEAVGKLARGDDHLRSTDPAGNQLFGPDVPFGGVIDWRQSAARIDAFVRAMDFGRPVAGAYQHFTPPACATIGRHPIGIYRSSFGGTMSSYPPGTITRCDDRVWVQTGRGHLEIDRVVADGQDHDAADFFVKAGFTTGDTFDTSYNWSAPAAAAAREYTHAA